MHCAMLCCITVLDYTVYGKRTEFYSNDSNNLNIRIRTLCIEELALRTVRGKVFSFLAGIDHNNVGSDIIVYTQRTCSER